MDKNTIAGQKGYDKLRSTLNYPPLRGPGELPTVSLMVKSTSNILQTGGFCAINQLQAKNSKLLIAAVLVLAGLIASLHQARAAKRFTVAIDIGHSPKNVGTLSARNRPEYDFNRKMAIEVFRKLKKDPRLDVFLVNPEGKDISLETRIETINAAGPGLLVSIHHDSVQPLYLSEWTWKGAPAFFCDRYRGYSIFISHRNVMRGRSRSSAIALGSELRKSGLVPSSHHSERIGGEGKKPVDRRAGVYRFDDLAVLGRVRCPAVLLECGIIRNRSEETLLRNPAYRRRIAEAIASAVSEFFRTGRR